MGPVLSHLRASYRDVGREGGCRERGSEWVGAAVPPFPQLPIEEHGKGGRPSLFIPNVRSRYSGGSEPGWRKEQHAGQEQRGLNQTSLVVTPCILPSSTGKGERKGGKEVKGVDRERVEEEKRGVGSVSQQ
ncbi:hypothetical protein KUCAC02_020488 [Chaenocephalus aceratus]|nr:hypothetical protein KUCAC02_020488 [Chaenocephalus aceratus]